MWFSGPTSEAIRKAKQDNTLLIVFVHGKDEKSESILHCWNSEDVRSLCINNGCVALEFDKDSTEAQQFAEFYPLAFIPISFLINGDGIPLEIIVDGDMTPAQLKDRVLASLSQLKLKKSENKPGVTSSGHTNNAEKTKELIKQIKEKKEKATLEDEREKEVKRRDEGKSLLEVREKQREMEILAAAEERTKNKKTDREHLQKLREQIAADRAEKAERFQTTRYEEDDERRKKRETAESQEKAALEKQTAEMENLHKQARIQFRLADGRTVVEKFDSDRPFLDAYNFIASNLNLHAKFQLIQMYPRREFSQSDHNKSFAELDLTPSAVLMILTSDKNRASTSVQLYNRNWISSVFSLVFLPLTVVYNWLYSFIFPQQQAISKTPTTSHSNTNSKKTTPEQGGNIRRLNYATNDKRKGDDDNATWNGNSTQQL